MRDSEIAERWLAAARRGLSPSESDRERVRMALQAALTGSASEPEAEAVQEVATWASGSLAKGALLLCVAAGAGAAGYWQGRRSAIEEQRHSVANVTSPVESRELPVAAAPRSPDLAPPPPSSSAAALPALSHKALAVVTMPARSAAPGAAAASVDEGEELRTLRRVERALRAGNPLLALALLEELDRAVPSGKLVEERLAAYTVASCEQTFGPSRTSLLSSFLDRYPQSVYAARLRASCASEPPGDAVTETNEQDPNKPP